MPMSSKIVEELDDNEHMNPGVLSWVEELRRVSVAVSKKTGRAAANRVQLFYLLHWTPDGAGYGVTVNKGRDP